MDKVSVLRGGARIAFSMWDVGGIWLNWLINCINLLIFCMLISVSLAGDDQFLDHLPIACKDSAAILVMFDLTNRSTLNKFVLSFLQFSESIMWNDKLLIWKLCFFLFSAIVWYQRARKWNKVQIFTYTATVLCVLKLVESQLDISFFLLLIIQAAIPILIGTKFDDFAQLPLEVQWTIVNQVWFCCSSSFDLYDLAAEQMLSWNRNC